MVIAAVPIAQQMMRDGDRVRWDDGTHWGGLIVMIVLALLVVGVIVWAVMYSSRRSSAPPAPGGAWPAGQTPPGPSARDVLDQRYARGEIDTAEYEERRSKLG